MIFYNAHVSSALLNVTDLTVRFHTASGFAEAVRDVSFSIAPGEVLGVVGESGSGKSATSLAIMRLLVPQAQAQGHIEFQGRDLLEIPEAEMRAIRGSQITMIFQEPMTALNPLMRIGDQIAEALLAHQKIGRRDARESVIQALREVGIPEPTIRARDYPHQLSGGQRQRVMIAMALINRPQLLIADEPTTALDVTVQAQILELLSELRAKFNLAMLFISHDLGVVSQVADRVAVMYRGEIVELGSARQVFTNPLHEYTQGLLQAIPTLKTQRGQLLATVEKRQYSDVPLKELESGHWARV